MKATAIGLLAIASLFTSLLIASGAVAAGEMKEELQMYDEATPAELQSIFGLQPGRNGEMVQENSSHFARPLPLPLPNRRIPSRPDRLVQINVDIATQTLTAFFPEGQYSALISSARPGYHTKTGCFSHPHLELMHYSSVYENSPMPHSMFYYGGFAIHGTLEESHLGRPASHGCVRVSRADAGYLYSIVETYGAANTRICVR